MKNELQCGQAQFYFIFFKKITSTDYKSLKKIQGVFKQFGRISFVGI